MANKFNDEELSRILTAHEHGVLISGGDMQQKAYPGCIAQIAYKCGYFPDTITKRENDMSDIPNWTEVRDLAVWFDRTYNKNWTTEEFIEKLTDQQFI